MATYCDSEPYLKRESYVGKDTPVFVTYLRTKKGSFGNECELEVQEKDTPIFGTTSIFEASTQKRKLEEKFGKIEEWKRVPMFITAKRYTNKAGKESFKLLFGWT